MSRFKNMFKKFGGEKIPDIIEYLRERIDENPNLTITVGCDSIQKRRKTIYACTIMFYDMDIRRGAHVVFFREKVDKVRDDLERLYKESVYAYEIAEYLDSELSSFYVRKDITDYERKRYKYHLQECDGNNSWIKDHHVEKYIDNMVLSDQEKSMEYKMVDIHLDYNPKKYTLNRGRKQVNISNESFLSYVPWLKGLNYRVFCKKDSHAATSAADLLLKD